MLEKNEITKLFNIEFPIIQAGMIWASGWKLASAVSNAGGLGLIGAGSMYPAVLKEHLKKCKAATKKPAVKKTTAKEAPAKKIASSKAKK